MHLRSPRRRQPPCLLLVLALAGLLLAGCGSSSSNTGTTSASATAPGGAGATGAGSTGGTGCAPGRSRRARQSDPRMPAEGRHQLPAQPQGTRPRGGGGFFGGSGGGPALPKGVTREQFQAALKKCGLTRRFGTGGRFGAGRANFNTPAFRKTLASFASCMNEHGVKLPAPNTSGKGPVFNTSGIDTKSATFQKAEETCRGKVHLFFPAGRRRRWPPGRPREERPPAKPAGPQERRRANKADLRRRRKREVPAGGEGAPGGG